MMPIPGQPAQPSSDLSPLFAMMSSLAQKPRETPKDKVKRAIDILDEVRDMDPKISANASMAIHLLRNGPDGLEKFTGSQPLIMNRGSKY
ncbi:MAG TPA: hypothetical protein VI728_09380 [Syntrophales bacterium]|nr:hypothetical protein [Syntrophales bacterium]